MMGRGAQRYVVPFVVGLAPPLLVALTWTPSGEWTIPQALLRAYALPIVGSELFVILVALREGMLKSLPNWHWSRTVLAASLTLIVIAVATAFLAPLRGSAIILTAYWIVHGLFGVSVLFLCDRVCSPVDFIRAYMVGFAMFAAEFFLFIYMVPNWDTFDWRNDLPLFSHTRHAGYYLGAIAALAIGVMATARRRGEWLWSLAIASTATGLVLWTGSRGAMVAVVGAWATGLLFAPAMRSPRGWGGGLASMLIALAVVVTAPAVNHPLMGVSRTVEATAKPDVTTGRTTIWKNVIGAVKARPLFGYGEGQMREVAPFSTMVQPHNGILQVALAWGLVGLLCVTLLAFAFARRALPAVRTDDGALVPAFMAMAALAILSLYDGALYYALPISIFMACGAIIASQWGSAPHIRNTNRPKAAVAS